MVIKVPENMLQAIINKKRPVAQQKTGLFLKIFLVVMCLIAGGFFIFRDAVLQQTLAKVSHEMEVDYNSKFTVKNASFEFSQLIFPRTVLISPLCAM